MISEPYFHQPVVVDEISCFQDFVIDTYITEDRGSGRNEDQICSCIHRNQPQKQIDYQELSNEMFHSTDSNNNQHDSQEPTSLAETSWDAAQNETIQFGLSSSIQASSFSNNSPGSSDCQVTMNSNTSPEIVCFNTSRNRVSSLDSNENQDDDPNNGFNSNIKLYISKRNERERSRVRNVNNAYDNLKLRLPVDPERLNKRMSKVEILRLAIEYIRNMRMILDEMDSDRAQI